MPIKRLPIPALRPFVASVWASDNVVAGLYETPAREHALPSGMTHIVFRLTDHPLRILRAPNDLNPQPLGNSIVGGVRSRFYVRELFAPSCSVGAVLRPGAAALLFGVPADELAERHTPLADLWGGSARAICERLLDAETAENRLAVLESALTVRLSRARSLHPAIASVIDQMHSLSSVETAVRQSGLSHRQFIARFRQSVGVAPKTYMRILRFQRSLLLLRQSRPFSLASLAIEAGYCDQAHFNRDFLAFTGVTPMAYQTRSPAEANHLPVIDKRVGVNEVNFLQYGQGMA